MPTVDLTHLIARPISSVWRTLTDIERYPEHMTDVREVQVLEEDGNRRVSRWTVLFKGSDMTWTEEETLEQDQMVMRFRQTQGDLAAYHGHYRLSVEDDRTRLDMHVEFDIGLPEMAAMLDPIAIESYKESFAQVVDYLERQSDKASA